MSEKRPVPYAAYAKRGVIVDMQQEVILDQKAEIERLTADLKYYTDTYDKQKAANERLLAKVEELEAAISGGIPSEMIAALKGADDE